MAEKTEKKEEVAGEATPGKKLPIWVIILIASQVLLVAAALVVFKMMSSKSEAEHEMAPPTAAEQRADPGKVSDPKTLVGPQYDMTEFIVNLIDDGRGPKYLKMELKFELDSEGVKEEIDSRLAQIRDELLILLSSKRQADVETADGKRILKDEIFTRVNKILVTGRIKRVYFTEFVVQ